MTYPVVLLIINDIRFGIFNANNCPQFVAMFEDMGAELPTDYNISNGVK